MGDVNVWREIEELRDLVSEVEEETVRINDRLRGDILDDLQATDDPVRKAELRNLLARVP